MICLTDLLLLQVIDVEIINYIKCRKSLSLTGAKSSWLMGRTCMSLVSLGSVVGD